MATTVTEIGDRTGTFGKDMQVNDLVRNAADEAAVEAAAFGVDGVPTAIGNLPRRAIRPLKRINATDWRIRAEFEASAWNAASPAEVPDPEYSFETGGGTEHITQSIATIHGYSVDNGGSAPGSPRNYKGAIGVDGDKVNGCDIVKMAYQWSQTHYYTEAQVTQDFKIALADATGKVNSTTFHGFAAGEVLFLGATGARTGTNANDLWRITFKFARQQNRTDIRIPETAVSESTGVIGPITKKGWEYLWVVYEDILADDGDAVTGRIKVPVAAYVEQVYYTASFDIFPEVE